MPLSAIEPKNGAINATIIEAIEFANPNLAVVSTFETPALQYAPKKIGKKPAITVVAKAEFAQSYMAHDQIDFF